MAFLPDLCVNLRVESGDIVEKDIEPDRRGLSSSVGKILKFSEKMVYIYNLEERKPLLH